MVHQVEQNIGPVVQGDDLEYGDHWLVEVVEWAVSILDVLVVRDIIERDVEVEIEWTAAANVMVEVCRALVIGTDHPLGENLLIVWGADPCLLLEFGPRWVVREVWRGLAYTTCVVKGAWKPLQAKNTEDEEYEGEEKENAHQPNKGAEQCPSLLA